MSAATSNHTLAAASYTCEIASIERLEGAMWRVELRLAPGEQAQFWPGQYLLLHFTHASGEEEQIPYSIACAPSALTGRDSRYIELHISSFSERAECIVCALKEASSVNVSLPHGLCFIDPASMPGLATKELILLAAGSGFSQIKSLVEGALALNPDQHIHIYWSNKEAAGFYLPNLPKLWAQQHENVHYHAIIEQPDPTWDGRSGLIYQVLAEDFSDLSQAMIYACGSPNMVYGTLDKLTDLGLTQENMRSDVFDYAPRG